MELFDSEEVDNYLLEFESKSELYGNDVEAFIEQRNIEPAFAQRLRKTLQQSQNIDLLTGLNPKHFGEHSRAEDLTNDFEGEFRFIRELGRGGMGTVWLAEQSMPQRNVAIKLILTDLDSKLVQRRFEAEQQSLALMAHAGIAKVIDAGVIEGKRPWFVMEYVDGIPITDYCNGNRLSLEERLELFLQLCDAIQHAHQKGVVHRDIKPGNILVTRIDDKPQVKVIDFGLAKIVSGHGANLDLTQANVALGSPMWMSPEQTQWKTKDGASTVDTRSDVYSLGVILYQLLTNTTPIASGEFAAPDRVQLFEAIRNEIPPYPSRRVADNKQSNSWLESQSNSSISAWKNTLRDDLDWVTMKALEKEPDRRFATVSALADDLRRFMSGKAVLARPPSAAYQLKKYIARNRAATLATAVAALSLVVCTGISVWSAMASNRAMLLAENESERARVAEGKAIRESELAEESRMLAEKERDGVEQLLEFFTNDIERANVFASGVKFSEFNRDRLLRLGSEIDALRLLDTPKREIRLRSPLANSLFSIGELDQSRTEFTKILRLAETRLGESDPVALDARNKLAFIYLERDEYKTATELLKRNQSLLKSGSVSEEIRLECELGLAKSKQSHKEINSAIAEYETVISKCKEQLSAGHPLTIRGLGYLGYAWYKQGLYEDADRVLKEAKLRSDRFLGPDSALSQKLAIDIKVNGGEWTGDSFDAENRIAFLNEVTDKLGESNPQSLKLRLQIADSLLRIRKNELAITVIDDGIEACKKSNTDRNFELASLWFKKMHALNKMRRSRDAVVFFDDVVSRDIADYVDEETDINLQIQCQAIWAFVDSGDDKRATEFIDKWETIARRVEGDAGLIRNNLLSKRAILLQKNGNYDEALSILEDICSQREVKFGRVSRDWGMAKYFLGRAYDLAGRPLEATIIYEDATEVVRQVFPPNRPNRATCELALAEHYLYAGKCEQSFELSKELLSMLPPMFVHKDLNLLRMRVQICNAEAAAQLGKVESALKVLEKIRTGAEKFEYLRESSAMGRVGLVEGAYHLQKEKFEDAEDVLLEGLKELKENAVSDRMQSIENALASRRYAYQLATLYEKWGKIEKSQQYREMKFPFTPQE